jgi:AraC-like DNA-binding protein
MRIDRVRRSLRLVDPDAVAMAADLRPDVARVLAAMAGDLTEAEWADRLGCPVEHITRLCRDLGVRPKRSRARTWTEAREHQRTLAAVGKLGNGTTAEIARALGRCPQAVRQRLETMERERLLVVAIDLTDRRKFRWSLAEEVAHAAK